MPGRKVSFERVLTRLDTIDKMNEELFQREMKVKEKYANEMQKILDEKERLLMEKVKPVLDKSKPKKPVKKVVKKPKKK